MVCHGLLASRSLCSVPTRIVLKSGCKTFLSVSGEPSGLYGGQHQPPYLVARKAVYLPRCVQFVDERIAKEQGVIGIETDRYTKIEEAPHRVFFE